MADWKNPHHVDGIYQKRREILHMAMLPVVYRKTGALMMDKFM